MLLTVRYCTLGSDIFMAAQSSPKLAAFRLHVTLRRERGPPVPMDLKKMISSLLQRSSQALQLHSSSARAVFNPGQGGQEYLISVASKRSMSGGNIVTNLDSFYHSHSHTRIHVRTAMSVARDSSFMTSECHAYCIPSFLSKNRNPTIWPRKTPIWAISWAPR